MEERFPKELPIARFTRDKRLAQIVVKFKDVTGSLSDITRITGSEGVDIRQSVAFTVSRERYAVYNAFVWLPREDYRLEQLVEKVKASPFVLSVQARDGVEGSIVDTLTFPIQFAADRVVLVEISSLTSMFDELEKVFGSGGAVIIYQQGVSYGKAICAELAKTLTRPYMVRNYRYGLNLITAMGWGVPTVLSANDRLTEATVQVAECFECVGRKPKGMHGRFMAGYLAGVFSYLSGHDLRGTETKCVAVQDDFCEFKIALGNIDVDNNVDDVS